MTSETDPQDDELKVTLARAFDAAWQPFIAHEGELADTLENRRRLAARIVAAARSGQIEEEALSEAGLIYLRVLAEAARLSARIRDVASPDLAPQADSAKPGVRPGDGYRDVDGAGSLPRRIAAADFIGCGSAALEQYP